MKLWLSISSIFISLWRAENFLKIASEISIFYFFTFSHSLATSSSHDRQREPRQKRMIQERGKHFQCCWLFLQLFSGKCDDGIFIHNLLAQPLLLINLLFILKGITFFPVALVSINIKRIHRKLLTFRFVGGKEKKRKCLTKKHEERSTEKVYFSSS